MGQHGLDALKDPEVAACLAANRGGQSPRERDALVDRGVARHGDTHHLRNELIQNRHGPRALEMQELGGAGQADPWRTHAIAAASK